MPIIRSNAIRIKRFRDLKADLRTRRDRLLVGIDVAKDRHVAQVKVAHGQMLDAQVVIPNTTAGFEAFWHRLQAHQAATGLTEVVCALEPTGTYHQALARFLEQYGVEVVFVTTHVAQSNRRTLDGTWDKNDPKDAANLCDLLERGRVCFYSLPGEPVASLRRLVRLLRHARVELGACKARLRNTLLPALGPAGEPLPAPVVAGLPVPLRALLPRSERDPRGRQPRRTVPEQQAPAPALPLALACEVTDLAARLTAVRARIAPLEAELVRIAEPRPAYTWLRTPPGVGPTVAAILLAEIGDIRWDHQVQPAPEAGGAGHRPGGIGPVRGDSAHLEVRAAAPPLGPGPKRPSGGRGRRPGGRGGSP